MTRPTVIFDGECGLCNKMVARLIRIDKHGVFRITGSDSEAGRALLANAGVDAAVSADTVVVVDGERSWLRSAAVIQIVSLLPLPWSLLSMARVVPRQWRDAVYRLIAKHRRKLAGADAACGVPPVELKDLWMQRLASTDTDEQSESEFEFAFSPGFWPVLLPLGVTKQKAYVRVSSERFMVRFGNAWVDTEMSNVQCVQVTGPYRWWKAIGIRGSMVDTGLTFGSNAKGGVCVCFYEKVAGMTRRKQHLGLTVTVKDVDRLVSTLGALKPQNQVPPA